MTKKTAAAETQQHIVGLDIGYSNVKMAFGSKSLDLPFELIRPAQASPVTDLRTTGALKAGEFRVSLNDADWVAFIDPGKAAMTRELHPDYPSTDVYQALVNAALIACCPDGNVIDHLITGLPTSQSKQQHLVDALEKRLIGIHKVAPSREIEVKKVSVIAQPTGTYCDILSFHPDGDMFSESNVLILDPGFFSVDWVAFVDGDLHRDTSESSLIAMSVMLEKLNEAIAKTHGGNGPGIEKLEIALQQGRESVVMYGERVLLKPFIDSVSSAVATQALQDLKVQMRHMQNREIDFLLLGGGGCSFYAEAAKELFPKAKVIMAENPITSNARGYWLYGAQ